MVARGYLGWRVIGRLKIGATREQAQSEADVIAAGLAARIPGHQQGHGHRRPATARIAGRRSPSHPVAPLRGGRVCAVDRMRERREPAARARDQPAARNQGAAGDRRGPLAHHPSTSHRERAPGRPRRRRRRGTGGVGHGSDRRPQPRRHYPHHGDAGRCTRPGVYGIHFTGDGRRIRPCAGADHLGDEARRYAS